jgi:adenosine deaminase
MSPFLRESSRFLNIVVLAGLGASCALAQAVKKPPVISATSGEQRASQALEAARNNPSELYAFLYRMPKGSDLHNHLSGAVYAESWIRAAGEDHLCVNTSANAFTPQVSGTCTGSTVAAETVLANQTLYDALVDAFSMRAFVPTPGVNGHDHFFSTFAKFGGTDSRHTGEWLDEVATRAAAQNEQYLELMDTPEFTHAATISRQIGWNSDLGAFRTALLAAGLKDEVATDRAHYDQADAVRSQREHCGQPDAAAACRVQIRYIYQILRGFPKEQVFAQTLLGFEVASVDPRVVGINYVMPEDGYTSMADYALHMQIVGFLHTLYPKVHISLHAGELAPGLVPYEGLCCHIRQAVEVAHAERIGHGVDVMYENNPTELLREMAAKHVMVEINLTSNDVILGVSGKDHPLPMYRKFGVPVSLSTDDEGVSRINMTHEYVRLAETYALPYREIKKMVRDGIEHTFLPGDSLWNAPEAFGHPVAACAQDQLGAERPSARCTAFLKSSEHAEQQWELERRFREFESGKF